MPQYTVGEMVAKLADAGLLTEREAQVYVLREVEGWRNHRVADDLDLSDSRVSDLKSQAETKIQKAEETLTALDAIQNQ